MRRGGRLPKREGAAEQTRVPWRRSQTAARAACRWIALPFSCIAGLLGSPGASLALLAPAPPPLFISHLRCISTDNATLLDRSSTSVLNLFRATTCPKERVLIVTNTPPPPHHSPHALAHPTPRWAGDGLASFHFVPRRAPPEKATPEFGARSTAGHAL